MRRRLRWAAFALASGAALVLFLSLAPTMRYVPACGHFRSVPLEGPMREQYIMLLTEAFEEHDIFYIRHADDLYLRYFAFFDGDELFYRYSLLINYEWKIASQIAEGVELEGGYFPPPTPVVEALEATRAKYGRFPKDSADGTYIAGPDLRFQEDCELMRVAVIKVEELPGWSGFEPAANDQVVR